MFYESFNYEFDDIKSVNNPYTILTQKYFCIKESINIYDYIPVHSILLHRPAIAKANFISNPNVTGRGEER